MKRICLILLAASILFTTVNSLPSYHRFHLRIVGGEDAVAGQFPYQASIRLLDNFHRCGGSILNSRFILTAAHCTDGEMLVPSNLIAVVGALYPLEGGYSMNVDRVVQHPEWDITVVANDIAMLRTAETIVYSDTVQPIALPTHNIVIGAKVVMSGWGMTSVDGDVPNILQFTESTTISNEQCIQRLRGTMFENIISDSIVCTTNRKNVGVCAADSGGPLVEVTRAGHKSLAGVISFGIPCAMNYPDGFTRVSYYLDWIHKTMEEFRWIAGDSE
ncbi:chymotrypsin-2-like [Bradysia coprophila]|uniref:chymotrypsin-2-like n=1 Tax=Bradysia coprophila TaxID=38358 RepID=UPI00187DA1D4|nr:chymotrypsin-2-like [Bradysia coprophila]